MTTIDEIRELAPRLRSRSPSIEAARQIPDDLIDRLATAGCFRMATPVRYGGDALPLRDILTVISELSRADGAIGWCVGQYTSAQLLIEGFPKETMDEVYAHGPDVRVAGSSAPKGRAQREGDHWRISGRWQFVSGGPHAGWMYLHCVAPEAGGSLVALVPAEECHRVDTWTVLGLGGTASHDVTVRTRVPDRRVMRVDPESALASFSSSALFIAAVAAGIATRAVEEALAVAVAGKRPLFRAEELRVSPQFAEAIGTADLKVHAAVALLREQADVLSIDEPLDAVSRSRAFACAAMVTALARQAVTEAYQLAGGTAIYAGSPLQRALRDIYTAGAHVLNGTLMPGKLGEALVVEASASEPLDLATAAG